jgi:hypothetical protein
MSELCAALETKLGVLGIFSRAACAAHFETRLRRELFEQRLRVLQVGGVKPLGEPTVDLG